MVEIPQEKNHERSDLLEYCPVALNRLLVEVVDMIIVVLDKNLHIKEYNRAFAEVIASPRGEGQELTLAEITLDELLEQESSLQLPPQGGVSRQTLKFKEKYIGREKLAGYPFVCQLISEGNWHLLAGSPRLPEREEYFQKLTKLNNELVNKSRELTKKNVELEKTRARIEKLLRTDELTGIANRRAFMEFFEKIYSLSRRHSSSLSLVMIDLDNFKEINDSFGHPAGDRVLQETGRLLRDNIRQEDMAARIGGDEFNVLLPETSREEAIDFARRVRVKIAEMELEGIPRKISASLGVAELREKESREEFLQRADDNLYRAKNSGGGRTGISPGKEAKEVKEELEEGKESDDFQDGE